MCCGLSRQGSAGESSAPCGINWRHSLLFIWPLVWSGWSKIAVRTCLGGRKARLNGYPLSLWCRGLCRRPCARTCSAAAQDSCHDCSGREGEADKPVWGASCCCWETPASAPRFRGGNVESASWWEECQGVCAHFSPFMYGGRFCSAVSSMCCVYFLREAVVG